MTTIHVRTNDQVLTAAVFPKIAPNNYNTVRLLVEFDESWDGYGKSALFHTSKNPTIYEKVLSSDNICIIPPEVLLEAGHLIISIKGAKADGVKRSTELKFKISDGMPLLVTSDPSEDVYNQLLSAYGDTATALEVERERINQFTKLEEGSTTGDAELQDIRIDKDGRTHSNAGTAVRNQVAEIHGVLNGEGITLTPKDFEQGSWAVQEGGSYASYLRIRCILPISRGDVVHVNPNGLEVTLLIVEKKTSTTILDSKGYTTEPFELGCAYDGYAIFIACKSSTEQIKITPDELTSQITVYRALTSAVGRERVIYPVPYEMGNIDMSNNGMVYNGATTRVRTPEGYTLPLVKGDIIRLTDYDNVRFYVGWILPDGTYGRKGWLTRDFVCPVEAEYVILVCNSADTKIPSAETLGSLIEVQTSISNELIKKSIAENQWQTKEICRTTKSNRNIRSINHRGYNTLAPENTLSAYRLSKRMGFEYVECDVSFTADGVAVILHDGTVDRTSNGTGAIAEMTFDEVRVLDFGSWFSEAYAGEKIPSFEEFIALCKYANLHPYIELKAGKEAQIKGLVNTVKMYGMQDGVTWISFTENYLNYVKETYSRARIGYLVNTLDSVAIETAQRLKTDDNDVFINSAHSSVTEATAELCANANIPLEVWTVDDESRILALPSYVSGFSSNKIIANEVFYDSAVIDDKAVVIQGGDAVIFPVGLKGEKGDSYILTETDKQEIADKVAGGTAPAYTYGTEDIEAGSASTAANGTLHFVYE